jgi:hypothetical protein
MPLSWHWQIGIRYNLSNCHSFSCHYMGIILMRCNFFCIPLWTLSLMHLLHCFIDIKSSASTQLKMFASTFDFSHVGDNLFYLMHTCSFCPLIGDHLNSLQHSTGIGVCYYSAIQHQTPSFKEIQD